MIKFLPGDGWNDAWLAKSQFLVVDLRLAQSEKDVLKICGAALKGKDSRLINGLSLHAFEDVFFDWCYDALENGIEVRIAGGRILQEFMPFGLYFIDIVNSGLIEAAAERARESADLNDFV